MKSDSHEEATAFARSRGLDPHRLPAHVAVIMDGNGRWAQKKVMNRVRGHEKGVDTVRSIVTVCRRLGIPVLTLYAFSTENWARPRAEVKALMMLLKKFLTQERPTLMEKTDPCGRYRPAGTPAR